MADMSKNVATFTRQFSVAGPSASHVGLHEIAADNPFHAVLNDKVVADGDSYSTPIRVGVRLQSGVNTLKVTVTNLANGGDAVSNPAGLLWRLSSSPHLTESELYGLGNPLMKYVPCSCGDPVDNATGNYSETVTDMGASAAGAGRFPVSVGRTYNSLNAGRDGPFGEDVPSSVELRWRPGEHQAALTS